MLRATFKSRPASNTEYLISFNSLHDSYLKTLGHYCLRIKDLHHFGYADVLFPNSLPVEE